MKIVCYEPKRLANLAKHGIDLADVYDFGWETAVVMPAHSGRLKAIGTLNAAVVIVVFSVLGTEAVSIVSMRPAHRNERRMFHGEG